jgi:hypothetical protein
MVLVIWLQGSDNEYKIAGRKPDDDEDNYDDYNHDHVGNGEFV